MREQREINVWGKVETCGDSIKIWGATNLNRELNLSHQFFYFWQNLVLPSQTRGWLCLKPTVILGDKKKQDKSVEIKAYQRHFGRDNY